MPLDPAISLYARPPAPYDPRQALSLASMAMQLRQAQQQQAGMNALRQAYADPNNVGPDGTLKPNALLNVMRASPQIGMKLQQNALARQQAQAQLQYTKSAVYAKKADLVKQVNEQAITAYESALSNGTPEPQARMVAQQTYTDGLDGIRNSGLFSPQDLQHSNPQFDPNRARAAVMNLQQWQAERDKQKQLQIEQARAAGEDRHQRLQEQYEWGAPGPQGASVGGTPVGPQQPDIHGQAYLKTLPDAERLQVKALAEGRMQFPSGFALRSPYWQRILQAVAQYDPSFDAVNYNSRYRTRADFTSGQAARNITSFNTAIAHLGTLKEAADKLGNSNVPLFNMAGNLASEAVGSKRAGTLAEFRTAAQAVADELERAFRGTGGNVSDIEQWRNRLGAASSPNAIKGAIKSAVNLLEGRIQAVADQYNRGMGTTADPLSLLSDKSLKTLRELGVDVPKGIHSIGDAEGPDEKQKTTAAPPQSAPNQQPNASKPSEPKTEDLPTIKTKGEYDALPSGTVFLGPDGKRYRKP